MLRVLTQHQCEYPGAHLNLCPGIAQHAASGTWSCVFFPLVKGKGDSAQPSQALGCDLLLPVTRRVPIILTPTAYFQLTQEEVFSLSTWLFQFLNPLRRKTSHLSHGSPQLGFPGGGGQAGPAPWAPDPASRLAT